VAEGSRRISVFLPLLFLTLSAAESEAAFEKESFLLSQGDTLNEDLYFGGRHLRIDGVVDGEIIAGAQRIFIRGDVIDDANVAAEVIEVDGAIGDDLRAVGRTVTVTGRVKGDVLAAGAEVDISRGAVVSGNLYVGAGKAIIDGEVRGSVMGGVGKLSIAGYIGKDVNVRIGHELSLSPQARINGDLTYSAERAAPLPDRSVVRGDVTFNRIWKEDRGFLFHSPLGWIWQGFCLLAALVVGFVLLAVNRSHARGAVAAMRAQSLKSIGYGFAGLILVPVLIILSVIFIISIPLGGIILLLSLVAFYVSKIYTGIFVGDALFRSLGHENPSVYLSLLLGLVPLYLLIAIPYIGWLICLVAVIYGLGGMILSRQFIARKENTA